MDTEIEKEPSGQLTGGGYCEVEILNNPTKASGAKMLKNLNKNTGEIQKNKKSQTESGWYKCKECQHILRGRVQFLIHQNGHQRTGPQLFHTQNGSIMEVDKLPNSFEIFTPKIGLKRMEQICDASKFEIRQVSVGVTKLNAAEIKSAIEESLKRKLRVRKCKEKEKQNTFDGQELEESVFPYHDQTSDSDWSGQSEKDTDVEENAGKKTQNRRKSVKLIQTQTVPKIVWKEYTCFLCPLPVTSRDYDSHCQHIKKRHLKNETYTCTKCEHTNTKTSLTDFIVHMNTHTPFTELSITCLLCPDKPTFSTNALKCNHMWTTHRVDGRYKCPYCPLINQSQIYRIEKHMLRHETSGIKRNIFKSHGDTPFGKWSQKLPNEPFNCTMTNCNASFSYARGLREHLQSHERQEKKNAVKHFRCDQCSAGFTNVANLKRHSIKHLANNPYVCKFPDCGKRLVNKAGLERHMYLHFAKPIECHICHVQMSQRKCLDRHMIRCHSKEGVVYKPRTMCAPLTTVKRFRELIRIPEDLAQTCSVPNVHVKESENGSNNESCVMKLESVFECKSEQPGDHAGRVELGCVNLEDSSTFAAQTAAVAASLEREGVTETQSLANIVGIAEQTQKVVIVGAAGETRLMREALKNDPLLAQLPEDFVNAVKASCGYTIGGELGKYPCKLCHSSYQRIYFYRRHMLNVHPEEAAQEFTETEKKLTTGVGLTCAACGFQSESSKALTAHMEEHFQDRKFHCSFCGIKLLTQIRLDKHVKTIHLSERKFKCNSCPKRFATREHLHNHNRQVHSSPVDPKELICKHCGKQLSSPWILKDHLKLHEPGRKLRFCKICNEKLSCAAALRVHIKRVHFKQMLTSTSAKTTNSPANNYDKNIKESEDLFL